MPPHARAGAIGRGHRFAADPWCWTDELGGAMHGLCIVLSDQPDDALAPFADHLKVEKYRSYLEPSDVTSMAEHFGLSAQDLSTLAAKLPEWHGSDGGIDGGRLFVWSTENPQAKYDWYQVGGRFSGYFRLTEPVPAPWWRRLLGKGSIDRANRAVKRQVDATAVLADPPAALLVDGAWHECPLTTDEQQLNAWRSEFAALFERVPTDAVLTAVDIHS